MILICLGRPEWNSLWLVRTRWADGVPKKYRCVYVYYAAQLFSYEHIFELFSPNGTTKSYVAECVRHNTGIGNRNVI